MPLPQRDLTRPDVWAPNASRVVLVVDDERRAMHSLDDGWWGTDQPLVPGQRYAFSLDGGDPRPDPRSLLQPDGVHGPSQVVDPQIFTQRPDWEGMPLGGAVLYEMHVGTFTREGTFDAAIERIPHLVDLGIQAVEIMPVAAFAGDRGWGYDGVSLYTVHAAYGGPEAMVRFIDACHAAGIGVVLDVVHNHLGPEGNYLAEFGPYFTEKHHTPWGPAVNLDDDGNQHVRDYLKGSVRQWICDFHVDGLRLDAVHELQDDSPLHFLADLALTVEEFQNECGRPAALIAESDLNQPATVTPVGSLPHAKGMHAQWADDVHHAIHSFVSRESQGYYHDFQTTEMLAKALERVFVHDGSFSSFRDQAWGAPVDPDSEAYNGHSFVVFMQNHDQVGNRPTGDRIGHSVDPGVQAAGAALYLLSAFTPMVFMGEEWNTSSPFPYFSHLGAELGPQVSEGRVREFAQMEWEADVPDPQDEQTWRSAVLAWDEVGQEPHSRMLAWYRGLIALRHAEPEIHDANLRSVRVDIVDEDTVVMWRGRTAVAVTRAEGGVTVPLDASADVLAAWDDPVVEGDVLRLPGPGAAVVRT